MRSVAGRAVTNITPSKPRSVSPFCTATAAPPMTETMTTRAVVPSTIPSRVSIERSLWLRISATEVRTDSETFTLLVPQGLDGVQPRRLDGRVEPEEDADEDREAEAEGHDGWGQHHRLLDEVADHLGEP